MSSRDSAREINVLSVATLLSSATAGLVKNGLMARRRDPASGKGQTRSPVMPIGMSSPPRNGSGAARRTLARDSTRLAISALRSGASGRRERAGRPLDERCGRLRIDDTCLVLIEHEGRVPRSVKCEVSAQDDDAVQMVPIGIGEANGPDLWVEYGALARRHDLKDAVFDERQNAAVVARDMDAARLAKHRGVVGVAPYCFEQPDRIHCANLVSTALIKECEGKRGEEQCSEVEGVGGADGDIDAISRGRS